MSEGRSVPVAHQRIIRKVVEIKGIYYDIFANTEAYSEFQYPENIT